MSGLYVHIPYCRKACHYCDFHFSTVLGTKEAFVDALVKEIHSGQADFPAELTKTIYFGGGTPSILNESELDKIFSAIHKRFSVSSEAEITIEANPDDLDREKLALLHSFGFNRLSIGCQSFDDTNLVAMNRSHTAEQAIKSYELARRTGFENISLDLIFALPDSDIEMLKKDLDILSQLNPEHVSIYGLTIEEKTVFHHMKEQGKLNLPSDKLQRDQYLFILDFLRQAGYEHYEISNFSKPGYYSRHNSSYWNAIPYLGVGPSAHSYFSHKRVWNISNNKTYINRINSDDVYFEEEKLSKNNLHNEFILTRLRQRNGFDLNEYEKKFGVELKRNLLNEKSQLKSFYFIEDPEVIALSDEGCLLADKICSDLFI